jgi:anti-anti-sigma regulatory factor
MTCKIDRFTAPDDLVILRVSGRIDNAHAETLRELTEKDETAKRLTIDLTEVTVVSRKAVEVLTAAEVNGVELNNCPAYVREWISLEKRWIDPKLR